MTYVYQRILLMKRSDTPCHARYLIWVLYYIPDVGLSVFQLEISRVTVFKIILRLRDLGFVFSTSME